MEENFQNIDNVWANIISKIKELDNENQQKVDAFLPLIKPQAISMGFILLTTNNSFIKF